MFLFNLRAPITLRSKRKTKSRLQQAHQPYSQSQTIPRRAAVRQFFEKRGVKYDTFKLDGSDYVAWELRSDTANLMDVYMAEGKRN